MQQAPARATPGRGCGVRTRMGLVRRVAGRASLLPGPLRTVRAPCDAHGSSKPRAQPTARRLMSGRRNGLRFTAVDLLMAIQVRQFEVRVAVFSPVGTGHDVVFVKLFLVEEGLPAHPTHVVLLL